jgi:predicted nucleotidyltransferase
VILNKKILLSRISKAIAAEIGKERLKGVILFGSEVRSTATESSDIDILVLLKGPVQLGLDLQEVISATYVIQLELDRCIHFIIADIKDYDSGDFSLYRIIKKEGIAA